MRHLFGGGSPSNKDFNLQINIKENIGKGVMFMVLEASAVSVSSAVTDLLSVGTSCLTWIMQNPLLACIFAGALIPVAFRVVKAAKRASK